MTTELQNDPLAYATVDEIIACVAIESGNEALKDLLAPFEFSKDHLARYAELLSAAGLEQAAKILLESIPSAPVEVIICPHSEHEEPHYSY